MLSARRETAKALLWALLISFAVLFFCTKSSPAYPINDWADANIYLSIGKGMTEGKVVYRDLYDHKGPLLYALHALCALISRQFLGVFIMEWLMGAAFLLMARQICRLYQMNRMAWLIPAILMVLTYSSFSFAEGDSAEEMALPLIMGTMYGVLKHLKSDENQMSRNSLMLHGCLAGCVFWIKFTMIGLHAGLLLAVFFRHLCRKEWKKSLRMIGWLLAGFALSTVPWVIYFGVNGAIGSWLKTYLCDNLFLYGGSDGNRLKNMIVSGWTWFSGNLRYAVPILLSLLLILKQDKWPAIALWLMTSLGALATFIGGKSYIYYGLVLAPAALPALAAIGQRLENRLKLHPALLCAVCVALTPVLTQNPDAGYGVTLFQPIETTMQGKIAAVINQTENPTLLNYGFMDAGFFTAANLTPQVKYFHQTNVPLQEMKDEQTRYIEEALCDYVIARGNEPECIHDRYELIAEEETPNFWYGKVYLYRRK